MSNDILSEYIEIIDRKSLALVANNIADMLLNLENLLKADNYFKWELIKSDPDDNKYVDAAITVSADYLVTNDRHFDVLKTIGFPKVSILTIDEFLQIIISDKS
jgi:predicted nucleic acid-binding protein